MEHKLKRTVQYFQLSVKPLALMIIPHLITAFLWGQQTPPSCYVHFDKSYYVSGEVAWYKIYLPKDFDGLELSFEVNLVDGTGRQIQHYFLQNQRKPYLTGYFNIPYDQQSGMYYLMLFATESSRQERVKILEVPFPIYNDLQEEETPFAGIRMEPIEQHATHREALQISIELIQNSLHRRSTVEAVVTVKDASGQEVPADLSISVSDWTLLYGDADEDLNFTSVPFPTAVAAGQLRSGLHLRGEIRDSLDRPTKINILGYYSSAEQKLQYSPTDESGRFFIEIDDFTGSKPLQFIDYESKDIKVHIQQTFPVDDPQALPFDQKVQQYLQWSRQRKKTYQLFQTVEAPMAPTVFEFQPKRLRDYRTIRPEQYEDFASFPEFLQEVYLKMLLVKQEDDSYKADFFVNRHGAFSKRPRPPLFFIDGKMTRDANLVAHLHPEQIDQVDFFHQLKSLERQFGPIGRHGVAMITTKSGKQQLSPHEEEDIIQFHGLLPPASFPEISGNPSLLPSHRPLLRPQLYWNPSITTDDHGQASFSFVQSDDLSTFCIQVVARGQNGRVGVGRLKYEVEY